MKTLKLKPEKEKLPLHRHPWIFSGALMPYSQDLESGEIVSIEDSRGRFIALGQFNPGSQIRVRLMEWRTGIKIDESWYREKIKNAWMARRFLSEETNSGRVFFSEADGIPGLIVDLLGDVLILQFLTAGTERIKDLLTSIFEATIPGIKTFWERSDGDGRKMEGLPPSEGFLKGVDNPGPWIIRENGIQYKINCQGQKTGFYTDQRENRLQWSRWTRGTEVLDAFSFGGGFGLAAQKAQAQGVTLLDASADALAAAVENFSLNRFPPPEILQGDGFEILRELRSQGRQFSAISLDPPKLVPSRTAYEKGRKAYKDLNLQAMALLPPGGILASFSCSGLITAADLRESMVFAARDLGRSFQILQQLHQAPCHPILSSFPESEYLKGFLVRMT